MARSRPQRWPSEPYAANPRAFRPAAAASSSGPAGSRTAAIEPVWPRRSVGRRSWPTGSDSPEADLAQVDRHHDPLADRLQIVVAQIGAALGGHADPVRRHDVVDVVRGRDAARDLEPVVVAPQQAIRAKVE